ncbi:MAG: hypothetical protein DRO12_02590, partial [Thermoprotei archaeon]
MCLVVLGFRRGERVAITTNTSEDPDTIRRMYRASTVLYVPEKLLKLDLSYGLLLDFLADLFLLPILGIKECGNILGDIEKFRFRTVVEVTLLTLLDLRSRGVATLIPLIKVPLHYFPLYKISMKLGFNIFLLRILNSCRDSECVRELGDSFRKVVVKAAERGYVSLLDNYFVRLRPFSSIGWRKALRYLVALRMASIFVRILHTVYSSGLAMWSTPQSYRGITSLLKMLANPYTILDVEGVELGCRPPDFRRSSRKLRLDLLDRLATDIEVGECIDRPCIAKKFFTPKSAKWVVAKLTRFLATDFWVNPGVRLANEVIHTLLLRKAGVKVPKILAIDLETYTLFREYVEGTPLTQFVCTESAQPFKLVGETLASIHRRGIILGDTRPSNFIISPDNRDVYTVDLEQARRGGDPSW